MDALSEKLRHSLAAVLERPARLGVAVSGGADSVCLLHALLPLGVPLTVLHVNHHLRGAESDADESFVRQLAASLEVPVRVFHAPPDPHANLEESARLARRSIFLEAVERGELDFVLLAHTRNDQAETVLFRLLRGAYTAGLAGMRAASGPLIRPFLDVTRAEIVTWLTERGLSWREDSSNADLSFSRNKIRTILLPQLEAEWNPALTEILANHARLAQEDEDFWSAALPAPASILDIRELLRQPAALRRRIVRESIRLIRGDLRQIDFSHFQRVLELAAAPDGHGRIQVPGVDVMRSFDWVRFGKPADQPVERDWEMELRPPAVLALPGQDTELSVEPRDKLEAKGFLTLVLRNWRPGDRYVRAGHQHEEKVKEMFHQARVPLWERRNWPMLCLGNEILWTRQFGLAANLLDSEGRPKLVVSERKRIVDAP